MGNLLILQTEVVEVSIDNQDQDHAIDSVSMIDSHVTDDSVNRGNEGDNKQYNSTVVECEITQSTECQSIVTIRKSRNGQARPERWIRNMS